MLPALANGASVDAMPNPPHTSASSAAPAAPAGPAALPLTLDEVKERAHVVSLPMRVPFRGVQTRECMLFAGPNRWVEWAPFLEYGAQEAARWLQAALSFGWLEDWTLDGTQQVAVNATIPAVDTRRDPEIIDTLLSRYPGCTTVKIKVAERGQDLAADIHRIATVTEWFADQGISPSIRLDANAGWSVEQAVAALERITAQTPLDYCEQPTDGIAGLREVRTRLRGAGNPVRIAADEAIRKSSDLRAAVKELSDGSRACDAVVLKAPPLGGVGQLVSIADELAQRDIPVTVSSALDSGVGLAAGLGAAAHLPRLGEQPVPAAGLATTQLFVADLVERRITDGAIAAQDLVPATDALRELAAPKERQNWWQRRLEECFEIATAGIDLGNQVTLD